MEPIIKTTNIKRVFRAGLEDFLALKGIDIEILKGRLTILKGRSGSGKTTLINILSTLDDPTEGEVIFDGKKYSDLSAKEKEQIRRHDIGFVFQSVALIPVMNAYENVEFALRLADDMDNKDERILHALRLVGMEERMQHMAGQLSGGEQQRVAIARAIVHRPKVLIADEPTGALDTENGIKVMQLFGELVEKEGITIVMTTHDPNLMQLGDDVYELEDGEIIGRYENALH